VAVNNKLNWLTRPLSWAIVLGFVGLFCGVMAQPLLLADPSNVAPVIGIVVTGPIGLVLGALLGGLSDLLHLNTKKNLSLLAIAVIAGSVGTLYLMVSEYSPTVRLIDAEIIGCEQVDQLLASQTKKWSEWVVREVRAGNRDFRPNWQQEIPDMLRAQPGVVLSVRIYQEAWAREQKWRWGGISKRVDNWKDVNETKQVFAPVADPTPHSVCERFVIGERKFASEAWETSNPMPPKELSRFLWLPVLQQVPPEYIRYIPKTK
jgi:hypothetical protein